MKNLFLREKDRIVLDLVVENYLKVGTPISSGFIFQKRLISDSPATIRNIMVKLEALGFLRQPHTSAGRVPTDIGLRFYVNNLLDKAPLSMEATDFTSEKWISKTGDMNALLTQVSRVLSENSDSIGFVLSPRISKVNFHHLRLIKVAENKVMVILVTSSNFVLTEIVETAISFNQLELDRASQYVNQRFPEKSLHYVRDYLLGELPKFKSKFESAFEKLMGLLRASIIQDEQEDQIILEGASKLIDKFDDINLEKLKSLFQKFEEKANLAKLLSDFISLDKVKVLIGSESNLPLISDCSLILSHYGFNNQVLGSLGIIGPKRIPYKKLIPLVDSVAKRLSQTISQNQ
ncbi:MAG: heat-inducible transcriptional repressor HrcA [Candidatus Aminicenantales bacterium]